MTLNQIVLATVLGLVAPSVSAASPAALNVRPVSGSERQSTRLEVGAKRAALVTGAALVLWGATEIQKATDEVARCRWCDPTGFDRWSRRELVWRDRGAADDASDVGLYGVALGSAAAVAWLAAREGDRREMLEDVFLVAAAVALTDGLTRGVQHGAGRLRPYAWEAGESRGGRDVRSFFSGHTSRAFAAAAAATQVLRLRDRRGWGWFAAAGFTGAAATGWLRIAANQHWTTDVLAAAAVGTGIGWAIPSVALGPVTREAGVAVVPAPGGFAIRF
jgi:membrane-associated phospholipid phosphatase